MNAREVTRIPPHNHTYGPHLHIRRRTPEASRVLHFYSALSFFPSLAATAFGGAREPVNERAHNQLHPCQPPSPSSLAPCSPAAPPLLETVFHIHKRSPARRGLLPDSPTPCSSPNPLPPHPTAHRDSLNWASWRISGRNIKHGSYAELHTPSCTCVGYVRERAGFNLKNN